MISLNVLLLFFTSSALLALAPGPDNIFVLTQSAMHGGKSGFMVTLGLCTGLLFHTAAVSCGVAAIFQASTFAFTALKLGGAAYLLYLAWHAFRAKPGEIDIQNGNFVSLSKLYRRGIVMNLTNPKVSIFFLAFLPQFADPTKGAITLQLITLGIVFIVAALIVFSIISFAAGMLGERLRKSPSMQTVMNRVAGTVFSALAIKLACAER